MAACSIAPRDAASPTRAVCPKLRASTRAPRRARAATASSRVSHARSRGSSRSSASATATAGSTRRRALTPWRASMRCASAPSSRAKTERSRRAAARRASAPSASRSSVEPRFAGPLRGPNSHLRHATGHATLMMVPSCAAWLRLIVTALVCVAGLARPVAQRSDGPDAVRAPEPSQLSAAHRETELVRLRKRASEEPGTDAIGIVREEHALGRAAEQTFESIPDRDVDGRSAWQERSRARGPPLA
jgi:hypothetical protein